MSDYPVILFAFARPAHLGRVLACLRENRVKRLYAFSDGPRGPEDEAAVGEVRSLLRATDWCNATVVERTENLGLGRNVIAGISEVATKESGFIVWEDDLICAPGCVDWLQAALSRYRDDERVMSVTGWTHPAVLPPALDGAPYFDGRAECWVWGTWSRCWQGLAETSAEAFMHQAERRGLSRSAYGSDLPAMARVERRRNLWAVRWLYAHFARQKLCLRPPWSMVEHIGFDAGATNAGHARKWENPPLKPVPAEPAAWPEPVENPDCRRLWAAAARAESIGARILRKLSSFGKGAA